MRANSRGKGTYASRACSVCRRKKIKCDESKPVCGCCYASGRSEECTWTGESARKPRTEAHFEAMRKRADALERYASVLESMLETCHREHGGQAYLHLRPKEYSVSTDAAAVPLDQVDDESSSDQDDEICVSAQNLTLDERDLVFYGNAAPFRFANTTFPKHVSIIPDVEIDLSARYMLMVEGADLTHYNPDFDWSRYLPSQVPLDRMEHDRVLDLLFKFFTSWCMRIVPVLFLRDMYRCLSIPRSRTPPKTSHYSPMLHNALLAIATAFSDDPRIRDYNTRRCFADEAKRLMESEVQRPNVSVIHALSILGSFHSSNGEQGLGYVYFGIASRVSQALGLSVDSSAWVKSGLITTHDMYDRNWAYWTTFTQEMCWCLYVGRDFNISTSSEGTIPVPYVDPEYDQIPWFHPSANGYIAPQPNYLSTTFAATCELMNIARRVSDVVNSLRVSVSGNRREVKDEQISSIDLQLHAWKAQLPPSVDITLANKNTSTPHKLVLHLAFWWTFILLHRPFFHRKSRKRLGTGIFQDINSKEIDHVKLCKRAADNILSLLTTYHNLYTLRYVPVTPVQIVFAAGTVYVLLAVQATTGLRVAKKELETYVAQAELCVKYLEEIGQSWRCAEEIAGILKGLIRLQVGNGLERRALGKVEEKERQKQTERERESVNGKKKDGRPEMGAGHGPNSIASEEVSSIAAVDFTFEPEGRSTVDASALFSDRTSFPTPASDVDSELAASGLPAPAPELDLFYHNMLYPDYSTSSEPGPLSASQSTASFIFGLDLAESDPASPDALNTHLDASSFASFSSLSPYPISSMETTGFLAMLGGEAISHTPCIPPFSNFSEMYMDYSHHVDPDPNVNMDSLG